jgi:hypothetical protein
MSTLIELMPRVAEDDAAEALPAETWVEDFSPAKVATASLALFAEEQIRSLARQIFLSDRSNRAGQVVFSSVDPQTDVAWLCMQVGEVLARQNSGTICVVEASPRSETPEVLEINGAPSQGQKKYGVLRDASQQLSRRLWFMPREVLLDGDGSKYSALWLRGRLAELRLEFDYTVLYAPAAGLNDEAGLLGSLCDGVVLVLQANATRRLAAQKARERLRAAHARLLGTVLSERTFPIPKAIYQRL